jgi:hypothetical protein
MDPRDMTAALKRSLGTSDDGLAVPIVIRELIRLNYQWRRDTARNARPEPASCRSCRSCRALGSMLQNAMRMPGISEYEEVKCLCFILRAQAGLLRTIESLQKDAHTDHDIGR